MESYFGRLQSEVCTTEWSATHCLSFQGKPQPVLYFHCGFQHRSHMKEENPCHESVQQLFLLHWTPHTRLCSSCLWTAFLFQQTLAPLGPALPCATRLLHPGCHRSGSPGLGEKLAGTSLTGALQDQWIESWWSMPCPKGRRITAGPCPESLWGSPSQVFALKKKVFPMKGKWNRASLSLCYATTKGYYVTFSRSKHNGIRLHSELDKAFTS